MSGATQYVAWFDDLGSGDVAKVGGKNEFGGHHT